MAQETKTTADITQVTAIAELAALALRISKKASIRPFRNELLRAIRDIKTSFDHMSQGAKSLIRIPKEFEWLLDNWYMAEREGKSVYLSLRGTGRFELSKDSGKPAVFDLAAAFLRSEHNIVDEARIAAFLEGTQRARVFSEKELWLLLPFLKAALLFELRALCRRMEPMLRGYRAGSGIYGAELEVLQLRKSGARPPDDLLLLADKAASAHLELEERMANLFTSLRLLSTSDFTALLHKSSAVETMLARDPAGLYLAMDEKSRMSYRREISRLAKRRRISEHEAASLAVSLSEKSTEEHRRHVGYYIFKEPLGGSVRRYAGALYFTSLAALTALLFLAVYFVAGNIFIPLLILLPLSEGAKNLCDWAALRLKPPTHIPRLELPDGLPDEGKTIACISALLFAKDKGPDYAALLEKYHIANRDAGKNLLFGILSDLSDGKNPVEETDAEIIEHARQSVEALNRKYGGGFFLFTRERSLNASDGRYMGKERKRGALVSLVSLLTGKESELRVAAGAESLLTDVRYVIALDGDTRLGAGTARELVGTMLHPLNRPEIDPKLRRVTGGYGILQPRVAIDLAAASKSFFSRAFAGLGGVDPYGSNASDLYQDLFSEGIFTGKGIFSVEAFSTCLLDRLPDNLILSHDLLEGSYLRCGFLSDIELTDGYPYKVNSYFDRLHRWTRGDWQISGWLRKRVPAPGGETERNPLSRLSKWKIFDNLRRSLVPVFSFVSLLAGFLSGSLLVAAVAVILVMATNLLLSTVADVAHGGVELGCRYHSTILTGVPGIFFQTVLQLMFLPYQAVLSVHAIFTALYRMYVSKKHLLSWVTAAESDAGSRSGVAAFYYKMAAAPVFGAL
ncbi:hypothetical protein LJC34_06580, partial [Oscillospiraceae bacterium OttesenSCG-928-G22]|nr:hypothetical protein [Oscillospiraceae bacterium OttesenSCG-928-G22]